MKKHLFWAMLAAIVIVNACPALAGDGLPVRKFSDFTATFVQVLSNQASGDSETRKGNVSFMKPDQIRIETVEPEPETMVNGPNGAWDHLPEDNVAFRYPAVDLAERVPMLAILSGDGGGFIVTETAIPEWTGRVFQIVPENPDMTMVMAVVSIDDEGIPARIMTVDFYGNTNDIRLSDVTVDTGLDREDFRFAPPAGTDIEDNR